MWNQVILNFMFKLRLNPKAWMEHLTSQLSWAAAWLLVTHVCPAYLVDELRSLCSVAPYDWVDGVVLLTIFEWWVCFYFYGELMLFYGMGVEFTDKIMEYCFREVKWQQAFPNLSWFVVHWILDWKLHSEPIVFSCFEHGFGRRWKK